jgi:hypothetical protein
MLISEYLLARSFQFSIISFNLFSFFKNWDASPGLFHRELSESFVEIKDKSFSFFSISKITP